MKGAFFDNVGMGAKIKRQGIKEAQILATVGINSCIS